MPNLKDQVQELKSQFELTDKEAIEVSLIINASAKASETMDQMLAEVKELNPSVTPNIPHRNIVKTADVVKLIKSELEEDDLTEEEKEEMQREVDRLESEEQMVKDLSREKKKVKKSLFKHLVNCVEDIIPEHSNHTRNVAIIRGNDLEYQVKISIDRI